MFGVELAVRPRNCVISSRTSSQPEYHMPTHNSFPLFAAGQLLRYRENNKRGLPCRERSDILQYLQPFLKEKHDKPLFFLAGDLRSETTGGRSHVALLCGHYYYMQARYACYSVQYFDEIYQALKLHATHLPTEAHKYLKLIDENHPLLMAYSALSISDWSKLSSEDILPKLALSRTTQTFIMAEHHLHNTNYELALARYNDLLEETSPEQKPLLLAAKARCHLLKSERKQAETYLKKAKALAPEAFPKQDITKIPTMTLCQFIAARLKQRIVKGFESCHSSCIEELKRQESQAYLDASEFGDVAALREFIYLKIANIEKLPIDKLLCPTALGAIALCENAIKIANRHNPHAVAVIRCMFNYRMATIYNYYLFSKQGVVAKFHQEHPNQLLPSCLTELINKRNQYLLNSCDDFLLAQTAIAKHPAMIRNAFFIAKEFVEDTDLAHHIVYEEDFLFSVNPSPACFDDFKECLRKLCYEAALTHDLFRTPGERIRFVA